MGDTFLFLHMLCNLQLKTQHFEYYNMVTRNQSLPPSQDLFLLFAVGCGYLLGNFSKLFCKNFVLSRVWSLNSLFLQLVFNQCFHRDFLEHQEPKERKKEKESQSKREKPSQVFSEHMCFPEHVHDFLNSPVFTNPFEFPDFSNKLSLAFPPRILALCYMPQLNLLPQVAAGFLFVPLNSELTQHRTPYKTKTSTLHQSFRQSLIGQNRQTQFFPNKVCSAPSTTRDQDPNWEYGLSSSRPLLSSGGELVQDIQKHHNAFLPFSDCLSVYSAFPWLL